MRFYKNKYNNTKTIYDGLKFDSKRELARYKELKILEKGKAIHNLRTQVSFVLLDTQYRDGKCVERGVKYIADFVYDENDKTVVEDTKGVKTPDYIIKRKLMLEKYNIQIKEI